MNASALPGSVDAMLELLTPKPDESLKFFVDVMGMTISGRKGESVYLRGWDDYERYSLKLTASKTSGMEHMALRARSPQALEPDVAGAPVLLIDELDRADEAFEAYLLEILSDFQVTIPELGTVKAPHPPIVIVTSNRTREIHDALKRRCLYHWVDYPSAERELAIVKSRVPGISAKLSQQVVGFVQALREQDFYKSPGVAETIDWATALTELDARSLTPQVVGDTLGALLKYQDDIARMQGDTLQKVLKEATSEN